MYKWSVKVILKGGVSVSGLVECGCNNSTDVAKLLLKAEEGGTTFYGMHTEDGKGTVLINQGDVSALELRPL